MKPWLCSLLLLACTKLPALELASLSQVRLQGGPLLAAQQTNLRYLLALEPERLLAPLKRESGLPLASPSYGNWENTGLDGHMLGHYLSALALMLASTDDPLVRQRLDLVLNELVKIQQANGNGYLGGVPGSKALWQQVQQQHRHIGQHFIHAAVFGEQQLLQLSLGQILRQLLKPLTKLAE